MEQGQCPVTHPVSLLTFIHRPPLRASFVFGTQIPMGPGQPFLSSSLGFLLDSDSSEPLLPLGTPNICREPRHPSISSEHAHPVLASLVFPGRGCVSLRASQGCPLFPPQPVEVRGGRETPAGERAHCSSRSPSGHAPPLLPKGHSLSHLSADICQPWGHTLPSCRDVPWTQCHSQQFLPALVVGHLNSHIDSAAVPLASGPLDLLSSTDLVPQPILATHFHGHYQSLLPLPKPTSQSHAPPIPDQQHEVSAPTWT